MIILNLAVTLITGVCIALYLKKSPAHLVFRYFTVLSNCFSALLSLAAALFRLFGEVPHGLRLGDLVHRHALSRADRLWIQVAVSRA